MIDCGTDWFGQLRRIAPTAVVLTHAHADHVDGLAAGAPCPVYATNETWPLIHRFPIRNRHKLSLRKSVTIDGVRFKAFPVEHSIRAPAVGFRMTADSNHFLYVPDVARIPGRLSALFGVDVYIGDGATIKRSMVRKRGSSLIGHAPIIDQLEWCKRAGIRRVIFTHCGSPIVRDNARKLQTVIARLGREHDIDARIASDGDRLRFPTVAKPQHYGAPVCEKCARLFIASVLLCTASVAGHVSALTATGHAVGYCAESQSRGSHLDYESKSRARSCLQTAVGGSAHCSPGNSLTFARELPALDRERSA
jgi:phosphoribosyl 1,2-cyclic phosphodiesterase